MLPKDVFSLFGSESLHICKWAHQFSLSRNDLDGGAFVYLEVDSGADSSPNPFPLALRKMVAHDKEPRGIFDMGLAIPKLVSALLPTTELRRENDPDPTASLAAWNVWKTVIAIRIFLFSSVSTPVLSAPLARKICGLLLAQVLDLFRLQMEILDKEIQTLSYPDGHCFRGWKSNLCSIDLYIQALRAFENIETSGMLRNLFGPLQESVTATVVSLNELYEIANPNLKRCGNPQRTKIRRKQSQPSITGCKGAQIAIYPYSEGQSIPSTAGRGYAPYDEPKVIVAHLLTPDDAYKYIPDYVQQQFYSPDQLWPTPHPYQLSEENLRANIPFTRERGTISSGDVEAQSTVLSQDDTALSTTYSATVAPSIAASDFLSSVNGQTFQDPPKCIDPKVIYQEPLTMNLPPKPPNTLRTGFRLESSTQTPTFREPKRKQRSKGSSSQSPDRRKRPTMFNNPFAPLYGKRSQL
ncbi:hypothetical protein UCRPC4_g00302 [Phaeomoniella chlamydospora]|uniref:Uncharacterized protein n=1 Tax=Phaeomoniella chlamydospora TaxID=158046 RepID=A0A0G2H0L8_PHACM|nr:hypothetical protein UCRPC4_g00302 [Phaeomoniella chlamydospora]